MPLQRCLATRLMKRGPIEDRKVPHRCFPTYVAQVVILRGQSLWFNPFKDGINSAWYEVHARAFN